MEFDSLILFDWFSFTSKEHGPYSLIELLGMDIDKFSPDNGAHGYRESLRFEGVKVFYGNREEIWCEMTGEGCRTFESHGHGAWDTLFEEVLMDEQYHITRVDVAYDDRDGLLNLERIYKDVEQGNYVSKMKAWKLERSHKGITVYHGSTKSDTMFRIYDKAAERNRQDEGHWVRFELQLRNDHATQFLNFMFLERIGEVFAKTINNYIRYVKPPKGRDNNKWRWPMAPYWSKFITTAEKLSLYVAPGQEYNLEKLERFAITQAGAAAAAYAEIVGEDTYLEKCRQKLQASNNPKYEKLIREHTDQAEANSRGILESLGVF